MAFNILNNTHSFPSYPISWSLKSSYVYVILITLPPRKFVDLYKKNENEKFQINLVPIHQSFIILVRAGNMILESLREKR